MKKVCVAVLVLVCALAVAGCQQKKPAAKAAGGLQRIHFDFDKSNIKPEFEPVLRGNAEWLKSNAKSNVSIEGHCDERGSNEYNLALGDRRAKSAHGYVGNLGIEGKRLSTISYGEERPLCTQHDESCWWQNRRAEFVGK